MLNILKSDKDDTIDGIKCDAVNCVYNETKKCNAGHIEVGTSNATHVEETGCLTFQCKK